MLIGYMRPYEEDSNCEQQHNKLKEITCRKIYIEEHSLAQERIQLQHMIDALKMQDKVIVTKLFILGDSTRNLLEILEAIHIKGAYFQALSEEVDTSNAKGCDFVRSLKHIVEFERDIISEKTKLGLHEAKEKGIVTGRPRKPDENVRRAITMYESKKYTLAEIKEKTGISKTTLYRYLNL